MSQNLTTAEVRLSYYHADKPYAATQGQEEKYSVTILLPKHDIATKALIDAAIAGAIEEGVAGSWQGVRPPAPPIPVYDGDGVRATDGTPFGDECKGHWVFTASSKQPVQVVDQNVQPIIQPGVMYSGVYARVNINFFAYAFAGKKGIGCGLNAIQKLRDGEPLSGSVVDVNKCFGAAPMQQGYAQAPQQAAPQAPAQYAASQQGYQQAAPQAPAYQQAVPQAPAYQQAAPQAPAYQQAAPQAPAYQPGYPQAAPAQYATPQQGYPQAGVVPGMPMQG